MRTLLKLAMGAATTAAILGAGMMGATQPASAQGGIVCEYGTAQYKRCCRESYRNKPDLGPSRRARDIDACMDRASDEPSEKGERKARDDRGSAVAGIRRIDCSANGCEGGCADNEVAISAFCAAGSLPTADGDRDVKCIGQANRDRPTVLVCAKR
ncbi:MAG TPA: hypothetical protein VEK73_21195 [Xanthobacteraceae bacterium]|nr:hypothetical protein [Xanthobacteraceae bacterium]